MELLASPEFMNLSGWIMTAFGFLIGAASLFFTYVQIKRIKTLERVNKEKIEQFIGDANYVGLETELLDEIAQRIGDPILSRYLVSSHQRACDMYMAMVDFYLSSQDRFSYEDLKKICQTTLVTYRWQERHWRSRIALRPENKDKPWPDEYFVGEPRTHRLEAYLDNQKQHQND